MMAGGAGLYNGTLNCLFVLELLQDVQNECHEGGNYVHFAMNNSAKTGKNGCSMLVTGGC